MRSAASTRAWRWRRAGAAIVATAALVLTACGGGSGGTAAGGDGTDGRGRTLAMWIMEGTNPDATPFFTDLKAAFQKQTGAALDVQMVPWSAAHDKFTTAIAGGTTPDVAEIGTTWAAEFGDAGALSDLTPRVQQAGIADNLVGGLEEAGTLDGTLYGMPWYAGVRSVIYRTDVFTELGITAPTTWGQLVAAGQQIKAAKPSMIPFPVAGDNEFAVYPFIWAEGGQIATESGGRWTSTLSTPEARRGIQFYADLALRNGLSTPAAANWRETDLRDAFAKGQAAMTISGSWTPKAIVEAAPELRGRIGAFPLPGPTGGLAPSVLGGSLLSVFSASRNQDLAWALVTMMSTGEFAQKWATESSYFPGTNDLLEQAAAAPDPLVAPFARQMVDAGRSTPTTPLFGRVQAKKTIAAMMRSILTGEKTVEQATTDADTETNQIFADS